MRVPLEWLREVAPATPDHAVAVGHAFTMLGIKLEEIEHGAAPLGGVVAARVLEKHDIEGARACRVVVDAGPLGPHEVVCGAHNFGPGDLLPLALPGARLANGMEIARRQVKLPRGPVWSDGMLCAPDELGVSADHSGILHLDAGEPGDDVGGLLGLGQAVLVFEVTPNRPDVMSLAGMGREARAAFGGSFDLPGIRSELPGAPFPIDIEDGALCPRYVGIVVDGVEVGPSPPAIAARLRAAGLRPINNVVDATNYVLLERGQPLHAFDLDTLRGPRIVVRPARAGERITTLDGEDRDLDATMLVIADAERPVALAGVMGGRDTEVAAPTRRVVIESAHFEFASILRTSKRLALRTEASARFERRIDPEGTLEAALRCADLIIEWAGGAVTAGTDNVAVPVERRRLRVRPERINGLLGTSLDAGAQCDLLGRLDIPARVVDGGYEVEVPGRIPDMTEEAHVAEDVARVYGINRIERTLPAGPDRIGGLTPRQWRRRQLRDVLVGTGCTEIVTWSFANEVELRACGLQGIEAPRVLNPLHAEFSLLRPSLLTGLLRVAATNVAHRRADMALYELGTVYDKSDTALPHEHLELGILLAGRADIASPHGPPRVVDVFDVKGIVEAVTDSLRAGSVEVASVVLPGFHPGRAGRVLLDGDQVGVIGELDPEVARRFDLDRAVVALLDADALLDRGRDLPSYTEISRFPEATRDLNVMVDDATPAAALIATARSAGDLLRRAALVDVYRGQQVGEGRKSVTISLEFGHSGRTLTDAEVDGEVARILDRLAGEHRAELRG